MVNYLAKFIPNLAALSKPIREVVERSPEKKGGLKKPKQLITDPEVIKNFEMIKQEIVKDSQLKGIDPNKTVIIRTDASDIAGRAVLLQNDRGILKPWGYFSFTFTATEQKWRSTV